MTERDSLHGNCGTERRRWESEARSFGDSVYGKGQLWNLAKVMGVACLLVLPTSGQDESVAGRNDAKWQQAAVLIRGEESGPEAKGQAAEFLENAANSGEPVGLYNYGICLRDGVGRRTNSAAGLALIRRAADGGYLPAIVTYAETLRTGKGVAVDQKLAVQYLFNGVATAPEWILFHLARAEWEWASRLIATGFVDKTRAVDLLAQGKAHMARAKALGDKRAEEYLRKKPTDTRKDDYTEYVAGDVSDGNGNGMQMPWGLGFCFPDQVPARRKQTAEELEQIRQEIGLAESTIAGLQSVAPAPLGGGAASSPSPQITPTPTWRPPPKTNAPTATAVPPPATLQPAVDPDADLKNFRGPGRAPPKKRRTGRPFQ